MCRQIANVRRYSSLRDRPLVSLKHVLFNRELVNFTYEIDNRDELVGLLSGLFAEPLDHIASLVRELDGNETLRHDLRQKLRTRSDRNRDTPFGRRLGWYVAVRLLKPRLTIETGTHDGLGSAVLLQALETNATEGDEGRLISIDIDPATGWLVPDRLRDRFQQLFGDSVSVLKQIAEPIDLAIIDSAHIGEHELAELGLLLRRAEHGTVYISDNPGTQSLSEFAAARGLVYGEFHERSHRHIHPGAGLGIALRPDATRTRGQ